MYAPKFRTTSHLLQLIERITQLRERIRASLVHVPWIPSLVGEAIARSAWGSTAIEGCTLSLEAVRELLEGKEAVGYPEKHVRMAKNYIEALRWIQKKEKAPSIEEWDALYLHKLIGEGALDEGPLGAYRKIDVRAGLHVGTPWKEVPKLMREMLAWLNGPAAKWPAILSASLLHFRFVEIHPFRDGNGRVGRALASWELYRKGFDTLHIFALDEVLNEHRSFYIKNLGKVQVEGQDLGGWLEFMGEMILETLERVDKRMQAIGPLKKEPVSLTVRQEKLLNLLREKGTMAIGEMAKALKVTVPGTHYILRPLLGAGLVTRRGSHKKTRYHLANLPE